MSKKRFFTAKAVIATLLAVTLLIGCLAGTVFAKPGDTAWETASSDLATLNEYQADAESKRAEANRFWEEEFRPADDNWVNTYFDYQDLFNAIIRELSQEDADFLEGITIEAIYASDDLNALFGSVGVAYPELVEKAAAHKESVPAKDAAQAQYNELEITANEAEETYETYFNSLLSSYQQLYYSYAPSWFLGSEESFSVIGDADSGLVADVMIDGISVPFDPVPGKFNLMIPVSTMNELELGSHTVSLIYHDLYTALFSFYTENPNTLWATFTVKEPPKGWEYENGRWYYYDENGNKLPMGWHEIDGNTYYIDFTGAAMTGVKKVDGRWYFFEDDGVLGTGGWKEVDGNLYYFDENSMAFPEGFVDIDGNTYYVEYYGAMATGWKTILGDTYYFGDDGIMQTGWQSTADGDYYLDEQNGYMITGWLSWQGDVYYLEPVKIRGWKQIDGEWYFFDPSGRMATGWTWRFDKWYLFGEDGAMQTGWAQNPRDNGWRYLGSDGAVTGWQKIDGQWYYFEDTTAIRLSGWQKVSGKWYYLDDEGVMQTGFVSMGGKTYFMNSSGVMQTGWITTGGSSYYLNSSGVLQAGWKSFDGKWYYLNPAMLTGLQEINGKYYYFNASGVMQTGWQKISEKWYYFASGGAMQTGWQKISGKWYYFGTDGMMQTGWVKVGSKWYYMNSLGVMQTGWQKISGKWYYMNSSGVMQKGTQTIDGKVYHFNNSGVWIK